VEELYRGDYRDAQRGFVQELRGAIKTVTSRWIDSICYHAMLGETYYHFGQPDLALQQFDLACEQYLQYPKWLLRVRFDQGPQADSARIRRAVPWGQSARSFALGRLPPTMLIAQGSLDNSQTVRSGGVVRQAQFWGIDAVEIIRCTALAIRRRNELLGPLTAHDGLSQRMHRELAQGGAPANHWSNAWIDLLRGVSESGLGQREAALRSLASALTLAGTWDHALTCVALLEQGRLQMALGNAEAADELFAEAGYSAFYYDDLGVLDESFRLRAINRRANQSDSIDEALLPAANWAQRERYDHLTSRLRLALAEELIDMGNTKDAVVALQAGQSRLGDASRGLLGNWATFLQARVDFSLGRKTALDRLASAVRDNSAMSNWHLQIELANTMFDARDLRARAAEEVYAELLADPRPLDWMFRPLESLSFLKTAHEGGFDRWIGALLQRDNVAAAAEVVDLSKRRRYHQSLPWAGRLASVRHLIAAPAHDLSPAARTLRGDLMLRFPRLEEVVNRTQTLRQQLSADWQPTDDKDRIEQLVKLWRAYDQAIGDREALLAPLALRRIPAPMDSPPSLSIETLQKRLQPGEAVALFHETPRGMIGFLFTQQAGVQFDCGSTDRLAAIAADLLRELGQSDGNRELNEEFLQGDSWQEPAAKLYDALFAGTGLDPDSLTELVVVPDGVLWYVPMEVLRVESAERFGPLTQLARIRYAPTVGLAFRHHHPWRRVQRTGVLIGDLVSGKRPADQLDFAQPLLDAVTNPLTMPPAPHASGPLAATVLDELVVLAENELDPTAIWAWRPLELERSGRTESLDRWLELVGTGPQRMVLPGVRTAAERGGRTARRRKSAATHAGDELFIASCVLMEAGTETALISRWRVGGPSTLDLAREFAQEMPHASPPDAWQRVIQIASSLPIDPNNEPRVQAEPDGTNLTAAHPFFWAGYLLIDSGWRGPPASEPASDEPLPADAAAPGLQAPPAQRPADAAPQPVDPKRAPPALEQQNSQPAGSEPRTPPVTDPQPPQPQSADPDAPSPSSTPVPADPSS
jgi:hypothetical protein